LILRIVASSLPLTHFSWVGRPWDSKVRLMLRTGYTVDPIKQARLMLILKMVASSLQLTHFSWVGTLGHGIEVFACADCTAIDPIRQADESKWFLHRCYCKKLALILIQITVSSPL